MASRPLIPNGTYRIKSRSSHAYLDYSSTGFVTAAANPNSGAPFQQWTITSAGDGDYEIKSDINGWAFSLNDQNQLFCSTSTNRVTWTIEPRGSDAYVIGNASDARAIQLPRNGPVTAETRNNQDLQRWVIEPDPLNQYTLAGFPTGKFRIRAVGTAYYWTPTRSKTHQDGNTIHIWSLGSEEPQGFFVNSKGNLSCGSSGAEVDVMGNALITTLNRQLTEPYPNPWSHPLPRFSYSDISKMITVKFYVDPVVSNSWPRAESEWRDKEFALAARSVVGTIIPSFQEIAKWAPVSVQWGADSDAVGFERLAHEWDNLGVEEIGQNMQQQDLDRMQWEIEKL